MCAVVLIAVHSSFYHTLIAMIAVPGANCIYSWGLAVRSFVCLSVRDCELAHLDARDLRLQHG